ncbi:MAG: hypothetical protein KAS32_13120 [Candidatus Peribacteraceae bacterium]|nr:hypothetical protein [Candidatus Peribacteraceae bacterium]
MRINLFDINTNYDPKTKTEEHCITAEHREEQQLVKINGKKFWADRKLVPLLRALNEAGLETRTHCAGHQEGAPSWVAIKLRNVEELYIRKDEIYNELIIEWKKS